MSSWSATARMAASTGRVLDERGACRCRSPRRPAGGGARGRARPARARRPARPASRERGRRVRRPRRRSSSSATLARLPAQDFVTARWRTARWRPGEPPAQARRGEGEAEPLGILARLPPYPGIVARPTPWSVLGLSLVDGAREGGIHAVAIASPRSRSACRGTTVRHGDSAIEPTSAARAPSTLHPPSAPRARDEGPSARPLERGEHVSRGARSSRAVAPAKAPPVDRALRRAAITPIVRPRRRQRPERLPVFERLQGRLSIERPAAVRPPLRDPR